MDDKSIQKMAAKARLEKQQAEAKAKAEAESVAKVKKEKEEKLKKEAAAKIKPKHYYDVKVECMLPATLVYKVLAEDANQAADLIKHMQPTSVKHRLIGRRETKLSVYDSGSTMIRFIKNLFR